MKNWKRKILIPFLVSITLLLAACGGSGSLSVTDISRELICQCVDECGEILSSCDCDTAKDLTSLIKQKIGQGQSKEQIIQLFVVKYGEQALAPKSHA